MKRIAFVGLGNFGFALLKHFDVKNETILQKNPDHHDHTYHLNAYDRHSEVIESLKMTRTHPTLFKTEKISHHVKFSSTIEETIKNADYIILAVSSIALEEIFFKIKPYKKPGSIIINTSKALENQTGKRYSQLAKKILGDTPYALLVGGTQAQDLFLKEPLGATIACSQDKLLPELQSLFNSYNLSVYPSKDIIGVEYASAFKNVISILAGITRGMGFSYGSETYIISRAAYEVETLVVEKLGGTHETFAMGSQCWGNDLWMSCTSDTRNKALGILTGENKSVDRAIEILRKDGKIAEGINTAHALSKIADISEYPLLHYMNNLFLGKATIDDITRILFNHDF